MKTFKLDKDGMFGDFHSAIAGFFMFYALMTVILSQLAGGFTTKDFIEIFLFAFFWALAFYLHKYKSKSFLVYIMEILVIVLFIYPLIF